MLAQAVDVCHDVLDLAILCLKGTLYGYDSRYSLSNTKQDGPSGKAAQRKLIISFPLRLLCHHDRQP